MIFEIDEDVERVVAFMYANIPTTKLVPVSEVIGRLAPLFWGDYESAPIPILRIRADAILADDRQKQSAST